MADTIKISNGMKYIDIHSHLAFEDYDSDREEVLARMKNNQVGTIIIGTDLNESKKAVNMAEQNENIWAAIGMHPGLCGKPEKTFFDEKEFEELISSPKVVAIGECGLEYFHIKKEDTGEQQKELFESQIKFAIKHNKALMLHCRDSYDDVLDILESYKREYGEKLWGNSHFFAGNLEQAKKFLNLGFTLSFTGVVTFARDYDETIKYVPQNSIMSETDAPFVAPIPYRGKRNEPSYVIEIVKKLAEIRGEDLNILNNAILTNFRRVFAT